jgi:hypothetical protein
MSYQQMYYNFMQLFNINLYLGEKGQRADD